MRLVENQSGTYCATESPHEHRRFELEIEIRLRASRRGPLGEVTGRVTADGLADGAELSGIIARAPGGLRYELQFSGDDGRTFEFRGHKRLALGSLARGLERMSGELYDETGRAIATTRTKFVARADLINLLTSLRWS